MQAIRRDKSQMGIIEKIVVSKYFSPIFLVVFIISFFLIVFLSEHYFGEDTNITGYREVTSTLITSRPIYKGWLTKLSYLIDGKRYTTIIDKEPPFGYSIGEHYKIFCNPTNFNDNYLRDFESVLTNREVLKQTVGSIYEVKSSKRTYYNIEFIFYRYKVKGMEYLKEQRYVHERSFESPYKLNLNGIVLYDTINPKISQFIVSK